MLNISDLEKEQALTPLLRLGFRPFFLLGAVFALIAMFLWLLSLKGMASFSPLNGMVWWHSHEMLFGFVPAIIAGFLLTAVQTWTSMPSVKGGKLLSLVLIWCTARVLIFANFDIPIAFVMSVDVSFLVLTAYFLAQPLLKIKQYRNMIFLPVLALMSVANIFTYLPQLGFSGELSTRGMHAMVLLTTLLVALLGGRVIPMFTANGTQTRKVLPIKWLELSAIFSLVIILVFIAGGLTHYTLPLGVICLIGGCLHLYRNVRWRPWVTLNAPLVWVLHFTIIFIPIGLLMLSMHFLFAWGSLSNALHSLTVGAIGGMILSMMSRVSLGHTGRALKAHPIMILAFIAITLAALVRSILIVILPELTIWLWLISGGLWCFAFAAFVVVYLPILASPRVDGRPG